MDSMVMRLPMRLSFGCMYQKVLDYTYYQKAKSGLAASGLYNHSSIILWAEVHEAV